ncbi:MAG: polysaccharide biosynthesis/export family protein [Acidobacteriota bacterium]
MMTKKILSLSLSLIFFCASVLAQSATRLDDQKKSAQAEAQKVSAEEERAIQTQIASVYENFFNSYRLGAGDVIAIYVDKHPEDSVQRVAVSPVGQVYYPLMGNVTVAGKTISQIQEFFTTAIAEYIKDPKVTVSLLEAQSAKIGVLGDVRSPGVLLLTRPMRVLDAITASGGITEYGSSSNVTVLRQFEDGRVQTFTVNVKKILQGKANPEENAYVRAGDTIIVHGNTFKTVSKISSMVGITGLITFITRGGR